MFLPLFRGVSQPLAPPHARSRHPAFAAAFPAPLEAPLGSFEVLSGVGARVSPDRAGFHALSAEHRLISVYCELAADLITPVAAFERIVGKEEGFLLESVDQGGHWSRFSFLGRRPLGRITARGKRLETEGEALAGIPCESGVLAAIEALGERFESPVIEGMPPLYSGVVGYLGYDVVREVERLGEGAADDRGLPDAELEVIGQLAAFDHWRQRVTLVQNVVLPENAEGDSVDAAYEAAVGGLEEFAAAGAVGASEPLLDPPRSDDPIPEVTPNRSAEDYRSAVRAAKEHILAGDIFQVVLSQRFDFDLQAEAFHFYRALRQINPSPYMYFLRTPELEMAGSSPEPLVKLNEGRIVSRPIAGTRPRGGNEPEDRRLAAELAEDPKELAEHLMLLDLARNDLGRVCKPGTLSVEEEMVLEYYSHVMHMTSQVAGELADGRSAVDLLRATLPAGTVSGAPKVRAMEIIDELEPTKRGPYAGVVGYLDFSGNLDTAIGIRTLIVAEGRAYLQAGAGIVADSDPAAEEAECRAKAKALLAAVHTARKISAAQAHGA